MKPKRRGRTWRCGGLAVAGLLALAPMATQAGQAPRGFVPYNHPVYRNGKRVLWHGAWRAAGGGSHVSVAARAIPEPASKPASTDREIAVIADGQDECASRIAGELVSTLGTAGLKARAVAGATSPDALAKAVAGDSADLAIAPMDPLLADGKATASWRERAPYVARLPSEVIEIIAPRTIGDLHQLADRQKSAAPAIVAHGAAAEAVLARLGLKARDADESLSASLDDLQAGKIDAVAIAGAGRSQAIADFGKSGEFHLISIPWTPVLRGVYAPARLTAQDRPNLVREDEKVDAVAAPMALIAIDAVQGSSRAPQFAAIVAAFFQKFDALVTQNADMSWRDVNLAATVDWPRLPAAQEWIASNQGAMDASLESFRKMAHSVAAASGGPGAADADKLYQSLMQWRGAPP